MKHKLICSVCNQIIRRPVDHVGCPGSTSPLLLKLYKPKVSTVDVTQEINLRELNIN